MLDRDLEFLDRILHAPSPADWRFEGQIVMERDGESLHGGGGSSISLSDGSAEAFVVVPGYRSSDLTKRSGYWKLTGERILISRAYCYSVTLRDGITTYKFKVDELWCGSPAADAIASRETYLGMTLSHDPPTPLSPGITSFAFGRRFAAHSTHSTKPLLVDSLQLAYTGKPFADDERAALQDLLRFLTGSRGNSWFVEWFDSDAQQIGMHYRNHGTTWRGQTIRPLAFGPWSNMISEVNESFPVMLNRVKELRSIDGPGMSAVLHHYNDGAVQRNPTSRMRDLFIALSALAVVAAKAGVDHRDNPLAESFLGRLDPSLTVEEHSTLLNYRRSIMSTGHHGDESIPVQFEANIRASALCANLFNRCFLSLLKYSGSEYTDAYSQATRLQIPTGFEERRSASPEEAIKSRIYALGAPKSILDVIVQEPVVAEDESERAIVFFVDPRATDESLREINRFSERVRAEVLRLEPSAWPRIRLEPFAEDRNGAS